MADRGKKPIPKTQREISISQQDPYVNPETGNTRGNPNDISTFNRGNQTSFRDDNVKPFSLGFKEIDEAIFYYMENVIKPTIIQNGVVQKVPIIYGSPERWKQIQKDGYYRDRNGKIMMPIIVFKRNNIEKNRTVYNKLDANYPNNFQVFEKSYSKVNTYDNFNILNNRIPTKQYYAVIVPDYVTITYDFVISTYYVEQLNKLIEAINYASDSYWGNPERFKFRARIDSFATPVEVAQGGERTVKSTFSLKLYGYIVPDNIQKELSAIKKFNNKNQLVFKTEIVDNLLEDVSSDTSRTKITQSPIISSGTNVINNTNVCDNAEVTVNSDSPPLSVASGGSVNLTNVNSAGTQIGTRSGTVITNPDSAITVNGSAYGSTPATVDFDVDVVDSSRAPIGSLNTFGEWEVPAGAAPVGVKILKTGQTVSYRTGDDGDIQAGRGSTFLVLPENNPFGNTNRFTDTFGGLTFANDWVIDWSTFNNTTVLGYYRVLSADADWNTSIDECLANTFGTFSGCRLPNIKELMNLNNYANTTHIWDYAPFSFVYTGYFWSSTSNGTNAKVGYPYLGLSASSVIGAVGSRKYIPVRTFTVNGSVLT